MTAELSNIDTSIDGLRIRRVAGRIGGEVLDLSITADLDDATIRQIEAALVRHKVLFFRRQTQLDDDCRCGRWRLLRMSSMPTAARG